MNSQKNMKQIELNKIGY